MKRLAYIIFFVLILRGVPLGALEISFAARLGYAPEVGGSMSSGWQIANLGVYNGVYDINRSGSGMAVSTVEIPAGIAAGADITLLAGKFYLKTGADFVYSYWGGKGKTLNQAGTEIVEVTYAQWSVDAPLMAGVMLPFWGETRIFIGAGLCFAYGMYHNSFKSASLNHSATFAGYALPLCAEIGFEYMFTDSVSMLADIRDLYGRSAVITSGGDYARIDFTGFQFTAGASYHINTK